MLTFFLQLGDFLSDVSAVFKSDSSGSEAAVANEVLLTGEQNVICIHKDHGYNEELPNREANLTSSNTHSQQVNFQKYYNTFISRYWLWTICTCSQITTWPPVPTSIHKWAMVIGKTRSRAGKKVMETERRKMRQISTSLKWRWHFFSFSWALTTLLGTFTFKWLTEI